MGDNAIDILKRGTKSFASIRCRGRTSESGRCRTTVTGRVSYGSGWRVVARRRADSSDHVGCGQHGMKLLAPPFIVEKLASNNLESDKHVPLLLGDCNISSFMYHYPAGRRGAPHGSGRNRSRTSIGRNGEIKNKDFSDAPKEVLTFTQAEAAT
jgi:hypothetical protein